MDAVDLTITFRSNVSAHRGEQFESEDNGEHEHCHKSDGRNATETRSRIRQLPIACNRRL